MSIKNKLSNLFDEHIVDVSSVGGGDISDAYKIITSSNSYFVKTGEKKNALKMYRTELEGLKHLTDKAHIKVPKAVKATEDGQRAFLILEWVEAGTYNTNTPQKIAKALVQLHAVKEKFFGLDYNNFVGYLDQINDKNDDWLSFYYQNRIEYQLKMAIDVGRLDFSTMRKVDKMFRLIEQEHPDVEPCLLHGDLWNGNVMIGQGGEPYFIDPAIYYGYREMDYAMMRLFGGFDQAIFDYIDDKMPLDKGYEDRLRFYQLYYVLVHVNIFGGSYSHSVKEIISYYAG